MAKGLITRAYLENAADAIRVLRGESDTYTPDEFGEKIINAIPTETASGSFIHITDAAAYPAESVITTLEPVQDLHGYDRPWPAGGGKNKFNADEYYGIYKQSDGTYSIQLAVTNDIRIPLSAWVGKTVTFSFNVTVNASTSRILAQGMINGATVDGNSIVNGASGQIKITVAPVTDSDYMYITYGSGGFYDSTFSEFQLEEGSTATSYEPYANICPITGHTGDELTRTGKNLLDITNAGTIVNYSGNTRNGLEITNLQGDYTVSAQNLLSSVYVAYQNSQSQWIEVSINSSNLSRTITNVSGTIQFWVGDNLNIAEQSSGLMLNAGSTALPYEPYQGSTHIATFPSTVYGGEHDWTEGKLTNKYGSVDLGTLNWEYLTDVSIFRAPITGIRQGDANTIPNIICSIYKTVRRTYAGGLTALGDKIINNGVLNAMVQIADSAYADAATFKAAMQGVQLVYELATPTETTLTPEAIPLLKGENNIWTDAGESEVEYKVDLQSYINKIKSQQSASTLSVSPLSLGKSAVLTSTDGADGGEIEEVDEPVLKASEDEPAEDSGEAEKLPIEEDTKAEPTESEIGVKDPDAEEVIYNPIDVTEPISEAKEGGETD